MSYKIETSGNVVTVSGAVIDAVAADETGSGTGIDARILDGMRREYRRVAQRIADESGKAVEIYGSSETCQDWMMDEVGPNISRYDLYDYDV